MDFAPHVGDLIGGLFGGVTGALNSAVGGAVDAVNGALPGGGLVVIVGGVVIALLAWNILRR